MASLTLASPTCAVCGSGPTAVCCPFDAFKCALGTVDGYIFLCANCDELRRYRMFGTLTVEYFRVRQEPHNIGHMSDVHEMFMALHKQITVRAN